MRDLTRPISLKVVLLVFPSTIFFPRFGFIDNMLTEKIDLHKGSGGLMQAVIIDFPSADDKAYY